MSKNNLRCLFFGSPEFAVPFLEYLINKKLNIVGVITQPDKPQGRHKTIRQTPVSQAAKSSAIPVYTFQTLKSQFSYKSLTELKPDIAVVVAYGLIIPKNLLDIPRLGFLNVHPSLLPKYRGPSPIPAPILNGDAETGITIMKLDSGMDTGPILQSLTISLDQRETTTSLTKKMMIEGPAFLHRVILGYINDSIVPKPQNSKAASYTKLITKDDGQIDWTQSCAIIERKIRAYQPWPGAYTYWKGKKLDILKAEHSTQMTSLPASAMTDQGGRVGIVTGGGLEGNILILKKVRLESKKEMPIEEFLRGHPDFLKGYIGQ